jgi:hypothetical protein
MAITIDATSNAGGAKSGVSTYNWNHTTAADATLIVVMISCYDGGDDKYASSVTYDNVSMTRGPYAGSLIGAEIYYLYNPTPGTKNIVVTYASTVDKGSASAISVKGAPVNAIVKNTATATGNPSCAVTTPVANCLVVDCLFSALNGAMTKEAAQTQIYQVDLSGDRYCSSYKVVAGAGATTMSWTGSDLYYQVVAVFNPNPRVTGGFLGYFV